MSSDTPQPDEQNSTAAERVAEAHRLLSSLRRKINKHPDLEEAIRQLELALNLLTTNTGGML